MGELQAETIALLGDREADRAFGYEVVPVAMMQSLQGKTFSDRFLVPVMHFQGVAEVARHGHPCIVQGGCHPALGVTEARP